MAADTYTTLLGALLMGTGNDSNNWGSNLNTSTFQILEDAIATVSTQAVTGGTLDLSGSPPPAAASQARYAAFVFTGVLGSAQTVKVPNLTKFWFVQNKTSGAFTLKFQATGGAVSTAIPQNSGWQIVQCDGATNITVLPFNSVQVQMPDGTAAAPPYSNINETNSGWYRNATQDWRLAINGTDVVQITGTGASSASVLNVLSPLTLQIAGNSVLPAGVEAPYAGISAPTGWLFEYGQAISRTGGNANLFAAVTTAPTGNTHTSTTVDGLSADLRGLGLEGAFIEGTGISTGTTIVTIAGATSMTISQATGSSANGITLRILPYGQGDGSTTFNVPDRRGRVLAGRDNMGGTAASRLTLAQSQGLLGTKLSATGGEEGHTSLTTEMPSHTHTATSNVTDPGHTHSYAQGSTAGAGAQALNASNNSNTSATATATTGITVATTNTSTGGGAAHNNIQPTGVSNFIIKL